uniref:Lipid-binding serum glycoprotein N-terminal domain-containing protein n=1 Tax=Bubo bubo TaxID=30461 RepID=A0A8C0FNC6_BUBBB
MLKLFGIVFFCGLLSPSQEVLSGLSCAVSAGAMQNVLSDAILQNGLLQQHLQGLVLPNILGEGGLLNSPTSITGLHLVKVWLPKLSVVLLPGIGVQLTIAAKLELSGNCLVGLLSELIDILVDVNITANIKCTNFESGTVQVVIEDCLCILGAIKIKLLSGLEAAGLWRGGAEPSRFCCVLQLCPVVDIVVNLVNIQLLGTLNGAFLGGDEGIWASLAALAGQFNVRVSSLQGAVKQVGGSIIPHDSSPSALPPLLDRLLVLGLRQSFLNAVLSLLIQIPPQTFPCTSEAFSGASHLQEAIATLIPAGCSACPGTSPLSINLALSGNPLILLEENKATVELSVMIQVFVKSLDGSILNLLLLKAVSVAVKSSDGLAAGLGTSPQADPLPVCSQDLTLNARVSIAGGRLVLGLSLGR